MRNPDNAGIKYLFDVKGTQTCLGIWNSSLLGYHMAVIYFDGSAWVTVAGPSTLNEGQMDAHGGAVAYLEAFMGSLNRGIDKVETINDAPPAPASWVEAIRKVVETQMEYKPGEGTQGSLVIGASA